MTVFVRSQTYQGKNNIKITMFSVYQVVDSWSALQGPSTAASQQQALLLESNDSIVDPRHAFCRNLKTTITQDQSKGDDKIIIGDFNEVLGSDPGGVTQLAAECQLVDIMSVLHPNQTPPARYTRGQKRLDYVLATSRVTEAARFGGYEEFQNQVHTDHRAYYIDFDTQALFSTPLQALARYAARGLHSNNIAQCTKFL
jgi:hypothetical protein